MLLKTGCIVMAANLSNAGRGLCKVMAYWFEVATSCRDMDWTTAEPDDRCSAAL